MLLGARANSCKRVELIHWDRLNHGRYRKKTAYSRAFHCRIEQDQNIGFIGKSHRVVVAHVYRHLANGKWPTRLEKFWDWLAKRLSECDVLMGDFNMAFFMVVPEMRSRGVKIDLAAWYPWKLADGTACADSCGIFFVNKPGQYLLETGPECLHANDEKGFFWEKPAVVGKERYPVFDKKTAPDFHCVTTFPKQMYSQR